MENYSLLMGDSSGDEDGGGVDGGAFRGHFPVPAACRNRLLSPDLGFAMAALWNFSRTVAYSYRGFRSGSLYRRKGSLGRVSGSPHTRGRPPPLAAPPPCGGLWPSADSRCLEAPGENRGSVGMVLRNDRGEALAGYGCPISNVINAAAAEAQAVQQGLLFLEKLGVENVVLESDSLDQKPK
ncbi:hypothetical protein QYE76_064656 [Lolium multiflorum]|uniref:RNase H type-1 domain-containing protein n=1 Tax=Lolium multiflorum TaxID=4521 RepID=A0AAD8S6W8_LOLMU|nr:hypothetical protein QYE76_064656 [Lolium multiflorum]